MMNVIRQRRAVRQYSDRPMDRPTVAELIDAAIQAPSAMNLQPWAFAVVLDRERIDHLGQRAKEWLLGHHAELGLDATALEILNRPNFTIFYNAPALVIVLATAPAAQASEDSCLAAQNLMLAARDKEIGSCWIGFARPWLDLAATKQELGIPGSLHVVAPLILGYPAFWPEPHGRKPAEIHWV